MELDADAFFDVENGFAVEVSYEGQTFRGVLDRPYAEALGVGGEAITLEVPLAELPSGANAAGQTFVIGDEEFTTIHAGEPNLARQTARFRLTTLAGARQLEITATTTDIRALAPNSNFSDRDVVRLDVASGGTGGLLRFDLASIPEGATITEARVEATVATAAGPAEHDIKSFECPRPVVIEEATWNHYATTPSPLQWDTPGAKQVPQDRIEPALEEGLGTGVDADDPIDLATGAAALAWIQGAQAQGFAVLLVTIETGLVNLHGALSEKPPKLVVWYK